MLSGEGPLHLLSSARTLLCCGMMSLKIPSRGPLAAHKTPFLQLNTYGRSAFLLLLHHPPRVVKSSFLFRVGRMTHIARGQRGTRRSAIHKQMSGYQEKERQKIFPCTAKIWKRQQDKRRERMKWRRKRIASWKLGSQDFGMSPAVYVDIIHRLTSSAFSGLRNEK